MAVAVAGRNRRAAPGHNPGGYPALERGNIGRPTVTNAHLPPVPPANCSPHGGSEAGEGGIPPEEAKKNATQRDTAQQGRQGNVHQNTTHSGHQQDR